MPPNLVPASSRRDKIPGTLVLDWQTKGPTLRRPMTACEACRIAKVKCSGKRQCDRCRARRLRCHYVNPSGESGAEDGATLGGDAVHGNRRRSGAPSSPGNKDHPVSAASVGPSAAGAQNTAPDIINLPPTGPQHVNLEPINSGWASEDFNNALEQIDWVFSDDAIICNSMPSNIEPSNPPDTPVLPTAAPTPAAALSETVKAMGEELYTPDTTAPRANQSWADCQCRFDLVRHVHTLNGILQESPKPRIDNMFRVTGDVIESCHAAVACANCHVGPIDLVFLLSVFQQTAFCFQQISQSGLACGADDDFSVGIGDYLVLLNDDATTIKSMLVLNLVAKAGALMDDLSAHAQALFLSPSQPDTKLMGRSPACLNQLNLDYVQQVTCSFKKLFRLMTDVFTVEKPKE